jgi:hypothetical protein
MNELTSIIQNIRLTEKASLLGEKNNQYVFRVDTGEQTGDQAGDRENFREEGRSREHLPIRWEKKA